MKIVAYLLLPALFASTALPSPLSSKRGNEDMERCCTDDQVNHLVQIYHQHLTNPDRQAAADAAAAILAEGYSQYSESVNSLAGTPLGSPIQNSKEEFVAAIRTSTSIGPVEDLQVFHDCKYIAWYWRAHGLGTNQYEVDGIHIFTTINDCSQLIKTNFEFNSIAWGIDTHRVTLTPPSG